MPRRRHKDYPDAWFHVVNRGIARRTVFESRADVRLFLSLLARCVREGRIEVHAYCFLTTHYHLLLRSPVGALSSVMQWVQDLFVRRFNRSRRRDGPLFRGRFTAREVRSEAHLLSTLRYIHQNPVRAGLVSRAEDYPHTSARFLTAPRVPRWLDLKLARDVRTESAAACPDLVERWLETPEGPPEDLDDLVRSAPPDVQAWMLRKARLADGTAPAAVVVRPETLLSLMEGLNGSEADRPLPGRSRLRTTTVLGTGLLRMAAGMPLVKIAAVMGVTRNAVNRRLAAHREFLVEDPGYAALAGEVLHAAIRRDHGGKDGKVGNGGRVPYA